MEKRVSIGVRAYHNCMSWSLDADPRFSIRSVYCDSWQLGTVDSSLGDENG